jgi:archaellum component FlaC
MKIFKSKTFKYIKNLLIGLGAAIVLVGALFKLESWEGASELLIIGLSVEAGIFILLGLLGPEKDYYWEKLYPGLDIASSEVTPILASGNSSNGKQLDGEKAHLQLEGMISELQNMSRSMASLRALQEVDFSGAKEQIKTMTDFYSKMSEAMADLHDSVEGTKNYRQQIEVLNNNIGRLNQTYSTLNSVYGNVINAMTNISQVNQQGFNLNK